MATFGDAAQISSGQANRAAGTVFVIDDDPVVGHSLYRLVQMAGYRVEAFSSAAAFLESGAPDRGACLILDVRMPDLDGPGLFRFLRERDPTLSVLFISGVDDARLRTEMLALGAAGWMPKPVDDETLLAALAAWRER